MSQEPKPVPLGEVLHLQRRWIQVDPSAVYTEIGVRSFGKGIFHKAPVLGAALGNKRVLWIEPGDFVFNNVFAWEGAVAIAGDDEQGKIGSHRFLTYTVNPDRVDIRYLKLFFATPTGLEILGRASPGSAGRNRTLSIDRLAAQQAPLPALKEQRNVVERIQQVESRILEASALRRQATQISSAILPAALRRVFQAVESEGTLGDVLTRRPRNGWSVRCDNASDGVPVLSLGAVTGFRYRGTEFKRTSEYAPRDGHFWLRKGDLLITRSNTAELVGHVAIYDGTPSPCVYPDLIMRLELDTEHVDTRFVWYWLQNPTVRDYIKRIAKGTSASMKKISQGEVMSIPFPRNLTLDVQRRIVGDLDSLQIQIDALRHLQAETTIALDALTPAILDQVFRDSV